jgi:DNA-directed RNA polymerase subunit K/omega
MPPKKSKKSKNNYSDDEASIEVDNDVEDENLLIYENETEEIEEYIEDTTELDEIDDNEEDENDEDCLIEKTIEDDMYYFENEKKDDKEIILNKEERISTNRLSSYEMVAILGERTTQLTYGAKPMIKNYETLSYKDIAIEELKLNMLPIKIKRPLPNGKFEIFNLDELYKDHLMTRIK